MGIGCTTPQEIQFGRVGARGRLLTQHSRFDLDQVRLIYSSEKIEERHP